MSQQDSITLSDFTHFLASGAFLREGRQVHVFLGPFKISEPEKTQGISLSCPFYYETEKAAVLTPAKFFTLDLQAFARNLLAFIDGNAGPETAPTWVEPSKADFEKAFSLILNLISEGQIDKAVPAVFARSEFIVDARVRARWLLELVNAPETLNVHGYWSGDEGLIGATPEILFKGEGRHLETMALAGTLAKSDGTAADLERSQKDQHEHRIVVEDIHRQLSTMGHVQVGHTDVFELPTLFHLKTPISVELHDNLDIRQMVTQLHPTAALGVFPRQFGWRWMAELPGQEGRARFGAPFTMEVGGGRKVISLVSIRNIQWSGSKTILGSGCGVVRDSELESEWRELARKRQSVLKIFGMMP